MRIVGHRNKAKKYKSALMNFTLRLGTGETNKASIGYYVVVLIIKNSSRRTAKS